MPVAADHTITVRSLAGATLIADLPATNLEYGEVLNAPGAADITVPMRHASVTPTNLGVGAVEVYVNRAGTARWGGYLWRVDVDTNEETVRLGCEGFFSRLRSRLLTDSLFYKDVSQVQIAWNLINYTQTKANGALGITRGTDTGPVTTRKRQYCCWEGNAVADEIADLSDADDGFDFRIDENKVWSTMAPRFGADVAQTFDYGTDDASITNVDEIGVDIDGSELVSQMIGLPESDDCVDCDDTVVVSNATALTTYGLLEMARSTSDKKDDADKRSNLRETLRVHRNPRELLDITTPDLPWGNYTIGDKVLVNANAGYLQYASKRMRVVGFTTMVANGVEMAKVSLDSVVNPT